jgi:hypothetical protein
MTKIVNANARAARTMLGGVVCSPSACRSTARTMMIRVNAVIKSKMPGRKARPVISSNVSTLSE